MKFHVRSLSYSISPRGPYPQHSSPIEKYHRKHVDSIYVTPLKNFSWRAVILIRWVKVITSERWRLKNHNTWSYIEETNGLAPTHHQRSTIEEKEVIRRCPNQMPHSKLLIKICSCWINEYLDESCLRLLYPNVTSIIRPQSIIQLEKVVIPLSRVLWSVRSPSCAITLKSFPTSQW